MNVKIQGGQSAYANSGSCYGVASYLEHEDYERMEEGLFVEDFFNEEANLDKLSIVKELDQNKAKLSKKDAKFFVITLSPSKEEIQAMGKTAKQQSDALKRFIQKDLIPSYAKGFGKDLKSSDILYFAKIHHSRKDNEDSQIHAHIVISRKTKDNRLRISPQTNHRQSNRGAVKSGFNRIQFFQDIETLFDARFAYERQLDNKFEYLNIKKKGSIEDLEHYLTFQKEQYRTQEVEFIKRPQEQGKEVFTELLPKQSIQPDKIIDIESFIPNVNHFEEDDELLSSKSKRRKKKRGLNL